MLEVVERGEEPQRQQAFCGVVNFAERKDFCRLRVADDLQHQQEHRLLFFIVILL
jgi:hypothetical protein